MAAVLLGGSLFAVGWSYLPVLWGAPWVRTPEKTVRQMLRLANLQPGQRLVDLGAGDGRVVIVAAQHFGAAAEGVEIDPLRCWLANVQIRGLGLAGRARVTWGNLFAYDLHAADVVTLYLLQGTNQRVKARLLEQLRPGARVVSRTFSLEGWTPSVIDEKEALFVYEIGRTDETVETQFV